MSENWGKKTSSWEVSQGLEIKLFMQPLRSYDAFDNFIHGGVLRRLKSHRFGTPSPYSSDGIKHTFVSKAGVDLKSIPGPRD